MADIDTHYQQGKVTQRDVGIFPRLQGLVWSPAHVYIYIHLWVWAVIMLDSSLGTERREPNPYSCMMSFFLHTFITHTQTLRVMINMRFLMINMWDAVCIPLVSICDKDRVQSVSVQVQIVLHEYYKLYGGVVQGQEM